MSRHLLFAVLLALLALSGCAPKWTVLRQAEPNPFVGKTEFAVLPVDYGDLKVGEKSEAQYLSEKDEGQRASFAGDKQGMADNFLAALREEASAEGLVVQQAAGEVKVFLLRPHVYFVEPGFYAVVASAPSQVAMKVTIESPDGKVLDEIELSHQTDSRSGFSVGGISTNPSSGGRLRDDAAALGEAVGEYLVTRVRPE